jgi:hypothetical protein
VEEYKHSSDAMAEWLEHSQDDGIFAKRVKNYVWNGSGWERQSSTSGGAGIATVTVLGLPTVSISALPTISVGALPSVSGQVSVSSLPTVSVGNVVSVSGLPTVSIGNNVGVSSLPTVSVTGLPTVSISALPSVTGTVGISSLPTVSVGNVISVSGLPTVSVSALPSVSGRVEVTALPTVSVGNTIAVSGLPTVSVSALPSISGQVSKFRGSTSVATCISGATTSLTLKASNTSRVKAVIVNNSTNNLYVKEGATATTTNYTYLLGNGDAVIIDDYVGQIDGIWNGVNGSAQVSETT